MGVCVERGSPPAVPARPVGPVHVDQGRPGGRLHDHWRRTAGHHRGRHAYAWNRPLTSASAVWTLANFSVPENRRELRSRLRTSSATAAFGRCAADCASRWIHSPPIGRSANSTRRGCRVARLDVFIGTPYPNRVGRSGPPQLERRGTSQSARAVPGPVGHVTFHSEEHLVASDKGIILLRKLLRSAVDVVAAGGDRRWRSGPTSLRREERLGSGSIPSPTRRRRRSPAD